MSPHAVHTLALVAAISGGGLWMTFAGLGKNALELRRRKRVCPSCGHQIRGRVCKRH